ncbi:MAG: barstar family protein [Candidatus Hodarchaeota archaeon]
MKPKKEFLLDGHNMTTITAFWDEVQKVLCPGFKDFSRNWNAFIDILRGGLEHLNIVRILSYG